MAATIQQQPPFAFFFLLEAFFLVADFDADLTAAAAVFATGDVALVTTAAVPVAAADAVLPMVLIPPVKASIAGCAVVAISMLIVVGATMPVDVPGK